MESSSSTPRPAVSATTGRQEGQAVDETLAHIDELLKILNGAASFLPGAGAVVPALQSIVGQIRKTRSNSETARELEETICGLIILINTSVKSVQGKIEFTKQPLSDERIKNLELFKANVAQLIRDLSVLPAEVKKVRARNALRRWFHGNRIERQLEDVKGKLMAVKENFKTNADIAVSALTEDVHATVTQMASKMDTSEYDKDLNTLPYLNMNHEATRGSEYLPGTRIGLLSDSWDWMNDTGMTTAAKFFVIYGAAGTGKSTFAHEFCRQLRDKSLLGAWFFFLRGDPNRGSVARIVPTIAYQLARSQPAFLSHIATAAREYRDRYQSGSLEEQFESLIMKPLESVQAQSLNLPKRRVVIVLDALDEADGDLISLLKSLKKTVEKQDFFRIVITTRPEPVVTNAFTQAEVDTNSKRVIMEKIPRDTVDGDIRIFLESRFEFLRFGKELIDSHPEAIAVLTERAEGLFIYARTVMNYLKEIKTLEVSTDKLAEILAGNIGTDGMSELDKLYLFVLQNAYDDSAMKNQRVNKRVTTVLAGLVLDGQVTPEVLGPLMGLTEKEIITTVEDLRSILSCDGEDLQTGVIGPLHLTFREFLADDKRCTNSAFYVDRSACRLKFAKACLHTLNIVLSHCVFRRSNDDSNATAAGGDAYGRSIVDGAESEVTRGGRFEGRRLLILQHVRAYARYACVHWTEHLVRNEPTGDPILVQLLEDFCKKGLLAWIEVMSYVSNPDETNSMLSHAHSWAKVRDILHCGFTLLNYSLYDTCFQEHEDFAAISNILCDAWELVDRFFEALRCHPEHMYTSGLLLAPDCSLVELYADKACSNRLISPRDPKWGSYLYTLDGLRDVATFSYDGRLLVLGKGREIEIRDASTGRLQKSVKCAGRNRRIHAADVHPNNCSLVSISDDGAVQEWDLTSGADDVWTYDLSEENRKMEPLYCSVAYNADGSRIVCCWRGAGAIFVWSTGDRSQPVKKIPIDPGMTFKTFSLDCDRDQMAALLSSGGELADVKYLNTDTGKDIKSLQITMDKINEAVFAKKNTMLVTDHWSKICVWNLEGDRATLSTTIYECIVEFVVTPSGDVVAVECFDQAIRYYDVHTGARLAAYRGHTGCYSLRFSSQGDRLVSISDNKTTRVWDTTREALSTYSSVTQDIHLTRIRFSPNGRYIVAISSVDPRLFVWDGETGTYLTTLAGHVRSLDAFTFSADSSILVSLSGDIIVLWDMREEVMHPRRLAQSQTIGFFSQANMAINAGNNLLAIVCVYGKTFVLRIYDISTGEGLFQSDPNVGDPPHLIRFSPDEPLARLRHVAPGKEARIWDHANGTVEEYAYDENVYSAWVLPFDIEGRWIVSSRTKRKLFWLPKHRAPFVSDRMDVHGDRLAIGSRYGTLTLLDMSHFRSAPR